MQLQVLPPPRERLELSFERRLRFLWKREIDAGVEVTLPLDIDLPS